MARVDAIDRSRPQKLYCQLAELLRSRIDAGQWPVGARVPTEDDLCVLYNVSKATVRLAVDELVSLGYLRKFQGKGTFVRRKKPEHSIPLLTNLAENGICRNPSCLTRLLEYRLLRPAADVRAELGAGRDDNCHYFLASTVKYDAPYLLQRTWVPYALSPAALDGDDLERAGRETLYVFLEERFGLKIHCLRETVDVAIVDAGDAALLSLEPGSALLRARHLCTAAGAVPIVFSELLYRTGTDGKTVEFERLTP